VEYITACKISSGANRPRFDDEQTLLNVLGMESKVELEMLRKMIDYIIICTVVKLLYIRYISYHVFVKKEKLKRN
jgi:hypothetical protein